MIEFRLPSLGSDMDSGRLLQWQVQPNDAVHKGQVVAVVDTAKAAIDVECWHEGVVQTLLVQPDAVLPVGTTMALLREAGETAADVEAEWARRLAAARTAPGERPALAPRATAAPLGVPVPTVPAARTAPSAPAVPTPFTAPTGPPRPAAGTGRLRATPAARWQAARLGVDLAGVPATGMDGAVTLADVLAAVEQAPAAGSATPAAAPAASPSSAPLEPTAAAPSTPASRHAEMRRVIAAAMARSKREIPHYYLAEDIAFERAGAWLAARNAGRAPAERLLPAALLLKAVGLALLEHPDFNGFWRDGAFVPATGVHLGVAISLREGGLVAPALHDVPALDTAGLTRALLDLVRRTRAGALRSSELADATLTVTNLGDQGVAQVFGVIYPPQVALVGFGRVGMRPWADTDGLHALPVVSASLSADHRASDGHRGARLLSAIADWLQVPEELDRPQGPGSRHDA